MKARLLIALIMFGMRISAQPENVNDLNDRMWDIVFTNPDSAISLGKAITAMEGIEASAHAKALAQIGVAYDITGIPDSALPYFLRAVSIQEQIGDSSGLSFTYNNMGLMYYAQYNYETALKYLNQSLQIDTLQGDDESAAGSMINIGIIYTYLDSLSLSGAFYEKAYQLYEKTDNERGMITALSNMGKVLFAQQSYKEALHYYKQVEHFYADKEVEAESLSALYNSLSNTYLKLEDYGKALHYAQKDLNACRKAGLVNKRQFAYETLNAIYSAMGDYEKAHHYLRKYTDLRDTILNENRTEVIEEMQTRYETEKTEKELAEVRLQQERDRLRHETEKQFFYGVAVLLVLLLAFLLYGYRSKQRINGLLREKNQLNEANIRQKEVMLGEIHHRVKNNLQLISSIVELQSMAEPESASALPDIQKRIAAIARLHRFLYQADDVEHVDMEAYLHSLSEGLRESFTGEGKKVEVHTNVSSLQLDMKTAVPVGLIVNELVTNALKHAFLDRSEGLISVSLEKQEDQLCLTVRDNGSGMAESAGSTSFGTKMIRSLCRQLKADWQTTSEAGVQHTFIIKRFKTNG